jgi:hypothetical protein
MQSEKSIPLPLTGEEVQEAVVAKLRECMQKNCHLSLGNAYTAAKIEVSVKMVLYDYGREIRNNEAASVDIETGVPNDAEPVTSEGTVQFGDKSLADPEKPMSVNEFRVESEQPVPVQTVADGKKVTKHLKYAPRKPKASA